MRKTTALLTMLLSTTAFGKCATEMHTISGVLSDSTGISMPKVALYIQWEEMTSNTEHLETVTTENGSFTFVVPFYTYSGKSFLGSDKCKAELFSINIRIGASKEFKLVNLSGKSTYVNLVGASHE